MPYAAAHDNLQLLGSTRVSHNESLSDGFGSNMNFRVVGSNKFYRKPSAE